MTSARREDVGYLLFAARHQNPSRLIPVLLYKNSRARLNPGVKFFFALPLIRKVTGQSGHESGGRFKRPVDGTETEVHHILLNCLCSAGFTSGDTPDR